MTTLASTTAMTAHLRQPAPAFIDPEIGRGFMGSPPTAHGGFSQPCPLTEGKRSSFSPSGEGLDVGAGYRVDCHACAPTVGQTKPIDESSPRFGRSAPPPP